MGAPRSAGREESASLRVSSWQGSEDADRLDQLQAWKRELPCAARHQAGARPTGQLTLRISFLICPVGTLPALPCHCDTFQINKANVPCSVEM